MHCDQQLFERDLNPLGENAAHMLMVTGGHGFVAPGVHQLRPVPVPVGAPPKEAEHLHCSPVSLGSPGGPHQGWCTLCHTRFHPTSSRSRTAPGILQSSVPATVEPLPFFIFLASKGRCMRRDALLASWRSLKIKYVHHFQNVAEETAESSAETVTMANIVLALFTPMGS